MNKKVSTLLVTAMILGGSLLTSSAFAKGKLVGAKVDADGFKSGETYFLINEGSIAVGFSEMVKRSKLYQLPQEICLMIWKSQTIICGL